MHGRVFLVLGGFIIGRCRTGWHTCKVPLTAHPSRGSLPRRYIQDPKYVWRVHESGPGCGVQGGPGSGATVHESGSGWGLLRF